MSTYNQIFGIKVTAVTSNPSDPIKGQVWFNTTDAAMRYQSVTTSGAWASGGNMANATATRGQAGTQTAAAGFGGEPAITATEEYDGTSWTSGGNLGTARYRLAGCGTQTSALAFGGGGPNTGATEAYNGTSWTADTSMSTARNGLGGTGTQTSALAFGGITTATVDNTEEFTGAGAATTKTVTAS